MSDVHERCERVLAFGDARDEEDGYYFGAQFLDGCQRDDKLAGVLEACRWIQDQETNMNASEIARWARERWG